MWLALTGTTVYGCEGELSGSCVSLESHLNPGPRRKKQKKGELHKLGNVLAFGPLDIQKPSPRSSHLLSRWFKQSVQSYRTHFPELRLRGHPGAEAAAGTGAADETP